jgi:ElaB/YqjD/DUF883 family membrane-anchored ribosome-binding protein
MDNDQRTTSADSPVDVAAHKIIQDLKIVARDAQALLNATAGEMNDKSREAREKLAAALESAKTTATRLEASLEAQMSAGAKATDKMIREHPYESVGIAFSVGLLLGVILNRK